MAGCPLNDTLNFRMTIIRETATTNCWSNVCGPGMGTSPKYDCQFSYIFSWNNEAHFRRWFFLISQELHCFGRSSTKDSSRNQLDNYFAANPNLFLTEHMINSSNYHGTLLGFIITYSFWQSIRMQSKHPRYYRDPNRGECERSGLGCANIMPLFLSVCPADSWAGRVLHWLGFIGGMKSNTN